MKKTFLNIVLVFIGIFFISTKVYAGNVSLVNQSVPTNLYLYDTLNYGKEYYDFNFTFKIADNPTDMGTPVQVNAVVYFEADINGRSVELDNAILKNGDVGSEIPATTKNNKKVVVVMNLIAADYKGVTGKRTVRIPMALISSVTKENNVPLNWKIYNGNDYNEKYASGTIKLAADPVVNKPTPKTDTPEPVTPQIGDVANKTKYTFLAPLGSIKCMDSSGQDKTCIGNNIGEYLNFIFKFAIGLCAALAVLMLIMAGITYMGDESIFGKTEAKHKMMASIGGLLIALAAWALLNTINPNLTGGGGINITGAKITITNFDVSGAATFDGKPISINFNKEAYPAAKIASQKTGVETAFILAMFAQETSNGSNTGKCNYNNANMGDGQLEALKRVATKLNISDISTINMSCSGGGSTHGGAIGLTQFIPTTWEMYSGSAKSILGHEPNPWNVADALMMTALFLKSNGGAGSNIANQENAACKYFGSCSGTVSCGGGITGTYGQCILGKKVSIQNQIDESIKKGEIN